MVMRGGVRYGIDTLSEYYIYGLVGCGRVGLGPVGRGEVRCGRVRCGKAL